MRGPIMQLIQRGRRLSPVLWGCGSSRSDGAPCAVFYKEGRKAERKFMLSSEARGVCKLLLLNTIITTLFSIMGHRYGVN